MPDFDVLIIGSGPAGAHAAYPLVEAGMNVGMLDGGYDAPNTLREAPDISFEDMRRTREDQYRWFLGDDFSGIPLSGLEGGLGGGQVSGNKRYVVEDADTLLPLSTGKAQIVQSLAKGGLGAAWGAACAYFSADELNAIGLSMDEMEEHYDIITKRIGISGSPTRSHIQKPLKSDHHASSMLRSYNKKKEWFSKNEIAVLQPHSAILTEDKGDHRKTTYHDMEYWADPRKSVYRPQFTVEDLEKNENFTYLGKHLVEQVREENEQVIVRSKHIEHNNFAEHTAKFIICAAGAVGSARILLQSLDISEKIPFVGKPHSFVALVRPSALGTTGDPERSSMCQLLIVDEKKRNGLDAGCAQLYSYKSLQLFRLLTSLPLPLPESLNILSMLTPSLIVADVRFPAWAGKHNTMQYDRHMGMIAIHMEVTRQEQEQRQASLQRIKKALRKLGVFSAKTMTLPEGSSSHFAGTIPVTAKASDAPLCTNADGKLHQKKRIFIADASVFPCLPCKPHTLTIMANANRIATKLLTSL